MSSNRFWRNTRTEKHYPDPLDTGLPPAPVPAPAKKIVCEFCGCQLSPAGEVMRMGEEAKKYRDHGEVVVAKDKEIARLNADLIEVRRERDALKASGEGSASGHRPGARVTR